MAPLGDNCVTRNPVPGLLLTLILSHLPAWNCVILGALVMAFVLESMSLVSGIGQSSMMSEGIQRIRSNDENCVWKIKEVKKISMHAQNQFSFICFKQKTVRNDLVRRDWFCVEFWYPCITQESLLTECQLIQVRHHLPGQVYTFRCVQCKTTFLVKEIYLSFFFYWRLSPQILFDLYIHYKATLNSLIKFHFIFTMNLIKFDIKILFNLFWTLSPV